MVSTTLFYLLAITLSSVDLYQMMFEQFHRCTGHGLLDCNLRVRKLNRTVAALYGNVTVLTEIGDEVKTSFDAYHSPLGNNQFYRYPMKIPEVRTCTFTNVFWEDYYRYIVPYAANIAKPGECPISPRMVLVNDLVLDPRMLPPYVPTGLWKIVWKATDDNETDRNFLIEVTVKVYPDGHF